MTYSNYIHSKDWHKKKEDYLNRYGDRCRCCGEKGLDLHHLSYGMLKHEGLRHLMLLCRRCHYEVHKKYSEKKYGTGKIKLKLMKSLIKSMAQTIRM